MEINKIELQDKTYWTHVTGVDKADLNPLFEEYATPPLIQGKLSADKTQPRIIVGQDGLFLNIRTLNSNQDEDPDDMVSMRIWVSKKGMLSVSLRPVASVTEVQSATAPVSTEACLLVLLEKIHEKIFNFVHDLQFEMDEIEEIVLDPFRSMEQIELSRFKLSCLEIHKFSHFQEEVVNQLIQHLKQVKPDVTLFQEVLFTLKKTNRNLDSLRERSHVVSEELSRQMSEHVSMVSFLLTIAAALVMPITVLSGLMGMNVQGLPFADHPYGFWIVVGTSLVISAVAVIVYILKLRRR